MSEGRERIAVEPLERRLLEGVHAREGDRERVRVELGLILVFTDERPLHGLAGLIDWRGAGRLSALLRSGFCTAEAGEQLLLPGDPRLPVDRLVLVGLGPRAGFGPGGARSVAQRLVEISTGLRAETVLIALPTLGMDRAVAEALVEALKEALDGGVAAPDLPLEPEAAIEDAASDAPVSQPSRRRAFEPGHETRWWVAADGAIVSRLRRVVSGPPRAAHGGVGLHT